MTEDHKAKQNQKIARAWDAIDEFKRESVRRRKFMFGTGEYDTQQQGSGAVANNKQGQTRQGLK